MSQHDLALASGQSGTQFRVDVDAALKALGSLMTGTAAGVPDPQQNMLVADTTSGHIAKRNHGDTDWDYLYPIDQRTITTTSGSDSYVLTYSPIVGSYKTGVIYRFRADVANTGSATLNINSLGAKAIKYYLNGILSELESNMIVANQIVEVVYDSVANAMILQNPATPAVGTVVQVVTYQTQTGVSGTLMIPWDASIPQITEGSEFLSVTITPKKSTNILHIDANLFIAYDTSNPVGVSVCLFKVGTSNAIAGVNRYGANGMTVRLKHVIVAGGTAAITFKIRAGTAITPTYPLYMNHSAVWGGNTLTSGITITEVAA